MEVEVSRSVLLGTAVSVGLLHTLVGIDHYLPFVVLGRARRWSVAKVAGITALCGVGHVLGSIALGAVGIALSAALGTLEWVESVRASLAAWGLIAFGLVYMSWAWVRMHRNQRHSHVHAHADGSLHDHDHNHHAEHLHPHARPRAAPQGSVAPAADLAVPASLTFWSVFIIFALGPCEPLIPVLMAPAVTHDYWLVAQVAAAFSAVTIGTMTSMAVVGSLGLQLARFDRAERYANVLAGAAIALSGLAIQVLGI